MTEWLELMLDEVRRKKEERDEATAEDHRRAAHQDQSASVTEAASARSTQAAGRTVR